MNLANYFGIAFVAVGAALISWQKTDPKKKMTKYFVAMAVAVVLFATRNILIDQVTLKADFWPVMFWVGLGGVIVPLLLILFHHPHIRKQAEKGVWHLLFSGLLSGLALIAFTKAISIGSVTVVSAFLATKPLLVLVLATLLSFWHPKVIRERHSSSAMLIKVVATALIVSGAIFVLM